MSKDKEAVLQRVFDLLFLDMDENGEHYSEDKERNVELLDLIAEEVRPCYEHLFHE